MLATAHWFICHFASQRDVPSEMPAAISRHHTRITRFEDYTVLREIVRLPSPRQMNEEYANSSLL